MFGRNRQRIAEAEAVGLAQSADPGAAFAFVGQQDHRAAPAAQPVGEMIVHRRDAGAAVDDEQHGSGFLHRRLGLQPHAAGDGLAIGIFQAGRIDGGEFEIAEMCGTLAAVAGDTGRVVDNGQPSSDQAIEQRRFADIRPADNGDLGGHGSGRVSDKQSGWRRR